VLAEIREKPLFVQLKCFEIKRGGNVCLATEVMIEAAHARAAPLDNVAAGGGAQALFEEQVQRCLENLVAPGP